MLRFGRSPSLLPIPAASTNRHGASTLTLHARTPEQMPTHRRSSVQTAHTVPSPSVKRRNSRSCFRHKSQRGAAAFTPTESRHACSMWDPFHKVPYASKTKCVRGNTSSWLRVTQAVPRPPERAPFGCPDHEEDRRVSPTGPEPDERAAASPHPKWAPPRLRPPWPTPPFQDIAPSVPRTGDTQVSPEPTAPRRHRSPEVPVKFRAQPCRKTAVDPAGSP